MDRDKLILTLRQIKTLADECLASGQGSQEQRRTAKKTPSSPLPPARVSEPMSIDFDMPLRPFIKRYAKGMSGPRKFVLLLSRLVKGVLEAEVPLREIQNHWNRMKGKTLLNMDFNYFFPAQAKENDLVESRKKGSYSLRPSWRDVFRS